MSIDSLIISVSLSHQELICSCGGGWFGRGTRKQILTNLACPESSRSNHSHYQLDVDVNSNSCFLRLTFVEIQAGLGTGNGFAVLA